MNDSLYVETSALLRVLLEGDAALEASLASYTRLVTSSLTFVEAHRAINRARREKRIAPRQHRELQRRLMAVERSSEILALDDQVLERARRDMQVEPVRTLDALHVASVMAWEDQVGRIDMASCDVRVRENAQAIGITLVSSGARTAFRSGR